MQHLQVLLVFSQILVTSSFRVDQFLCQTSYWTNITCFINITSEPLEKANTDYKLHFGLAWEGMNSTCPLVWMDGSYSCVCKVKNFSLTLLDTVSIHLCNGSNSYCQLVTQFIPSRNIKMTPPYNLSVQETEENFNITWKSGYENHVYFDQYFNYDLLLDHTKQSYKSKTFHPNAEESKNKSVSISRTNLQPNSRYCIKVRSKPRLDTYAGHWSDWSPEVCVKTETKKEQISILLPTFLVPLGVIVGVVLLVFNTPAARMKMKTLYHIPSPAPLFQQHDGDMKDWLSHQEQIEQIQTAEDLLITTAVIIVPKAVTKDSESIHDLSVIPLTLTQSQTSYVCLPEILKAPPPAIEICPATSSYTQLPFSTWGATPVEDEEKAVAAPADAFFDINRADLRCSASGLPSVPAQDGPAPAAVRFCDDYFILNKTEEGVVPVLATRGINWKDPSDSPPEEEG